MDRKAVGFRAVAATASLGVLLSAGCGNEGATPVRTARREASSNSPAPVVVVSPESDFLERQFSTAPAVTKPADTKRPVDSETPTAAETVDQPTESTAPSVDPYAEPVSAPTSDPYAEPYANPYAESESRYNGEAAATAVEPAADESLEPYPATPGYVGSGPADEAVKIRFATGSKQPEPSNAEKTFSLEVGPQGSQKSAPQAGPTKSQSRYVTAESEQRELRPLLVTPRMPAGSVAVAPQAQSIEASELVTPAKVARDVVEAPRPQESEKQATPTLAKRSNAVDPPSEPTPAIPPAAEVASQLSPAPLAAVPEAKQQAKTTPDTTAKVEQATPAAGPEAAESESNVVVMVAPTPAASPAAKLNPAPAEAPTVAKAPVPTSAPTALAPSAVTAVEPAPQASPPAVHEQVTKSATRPATKPADEPGERSTLQVAQLKPAAAPIAAASVVPATPEPAPTPAPAAPTLAAPTLAATTPIAAAPAVAARQVAAPESTAPVTAPPVESAPIAAATPAPRSAVPAPGPQPVAPQPAAQVAAAPAPTPVAVRPTAVPAQSLAPTTLPVAAPPVARVPPLPSTPVRSPALTATLAQADERVRHAIQLAEKGAMYASRKEFTTALTLIAQARDLEFGTRQYSQATSAGLRALKESSDFVRPGASEANLERIVAGHKTPILKDLDLADLPPQLAAQHYYDYAKIQLSNGIGRETVGSIALYGLARIIVAGAGPNSGQLEYTGPAMALYQAALICEPQNFRAAHELGVLLASTGQLELARNMLLGSASAAPQPTIWKNLAVVHSRLGETQLAAEAQQKASVLEQTSPTSNAPEVQWVDPATFSHLGSATDPTLPNGPPVPSPTAAQEATPTPKPSRTARTRGEWDPLNLRR